MLNPQEIRSPFPIVRCQLAGGVQLIWVQRPGLLRKMAYWTVPVGSGQQLLPDNADDHIILPAGVAHFLEHQLFREEDGSSISDAFAALGAQDNAFTYFDQTGYGFRCTANFPQALRLLLSFTAHPFIDEESVATEREIINQELLMYRDYPDSVLDLNLRHALFGHHPAGEDIAGTPESLNQITPELLRSCHRAFYHPS
ncbi:MAG: insulinase family protein, partial [Symbiobacteriaceae bacterium]|nr:insulinase family protein [Symbiobacteriaceae bacterium]